MYLLDRTESVISILTLKHVQAFFQIGPNMASSNHLTTTAAVQVADGKPDIVIFGDFFLDFFKLIHFYTVFWTSASMLSRYQIDSLNDFLNVGTNKSIILYNTSGVTNIILLQDK